MACPLLFLTYCYCDPHGYAIDEFRLVESNLYHSKTDYRETVFSRFRKISEYEWEPIGVAPLALACIGARCYEYEKGPQRIFHEFEYSHKLDLNDLNEIFCPPEIADEWANVAMKYFNEGKLRFFGSLNGDVITAFIRRLE